MPDAFYERLRQGFLRQKEFDLLLTKLEREGYWIGSIRLRFLSSRRKYKPSTLNQMQQDRLWVEARDFYDAQIQQWINNAFRGNTRSRKRWLDDGWQLIGRWERGQDGFLHVHGFLAVYIGLGSALSCQVEDLPQRMKERRYHIQVPDVHVVKWKGVISGAVKYASKQAWMVGSGEDLVFARTV